MKKKILVIFLLAVLVGACTLCACTFHTHAYGEWTVVKEATCTENGLEFRSCECGIAEIKAITSTGHTEGEWTTVVEPTCTTEGSQYQVCSVCGETLKTESIDATGHSYVATVVDPTCIQGYTLHTCSVCGDNYKDTFVDANGEHNFQEADTCAYCEQNIADVAVDSYNMSVTADDNVRGYVVPRMDGKYDVYIKGAGAMKDYYSSSPFYVDGYTLKNAYVSDSVTSIGQCAFYNCSSLTNITIPDSVTSIGNSAFWGCSSLTSITIPSSVTSIGDGAFYNCSSLTSITIPDSVTSISERSFYNCSSLTNITIPDSVTSIGYYAFVGTAYYNDTNNWQNKVLYIGNCLIEAKTTIDECTIKEGTTCIANSAFYNCSSLTNITIPDSVTSIGKYAFCYCSSFTSVTFEDPNGWYVTATEGGTSVTSLTLTDPSQNAADLQNPFGYGGNYWYKAN